MDSRERLDYFWTVIKLAGVEPRFEAKLRELIRIASKEAPVDTLVRLATVIAEMQEDYLRSRN